MNLDQAIQIHSAAHRSLSEWIPPEKVGSTFVGILLGIELVARDPLVAVALGDAMEAMEDAAGIERLTEDANALAAAVSEAIS